MRRGVKTGIVGGVLAAMVGTAGYGAFNLYEGLAGSNSPAPIQTGPVTADEVRTTAKEFLAAWAKGDDTAAAALTNDATTADTALTDYKDKTHVATVKLTAGTAAGDEVPFKVKATLSYKGKRSTWTYDSSLTVTRGLTTGRALVDWKASVVHPKLTTGEYLETGVAGAPPVDVLDRNGKTMDAADYPSLGAVFGQLRDRYGAQLGGTPGVETWINTNDGGDAGETLHVLSKGKGGKLRTTLDAGIQAAAEKAVKNRASSSVVALQASTGKILAVANNPGTGFNTALQGKLAPGSTFKIVTAATLLEKGLASPNEPLACPAQANYNQGQLFHNVEHESNMAATFAGDFASSCNTAFISLTGKIDDSALTTEARDVFGIGPEWNTGVSTFDGSVPGGSGDEKAAEMIGQGQIEMDPLNMASIAATARTGYFHQPVIVDPKLIDGTIAKASRSLKPVAAQQLRSMMRLTAQSGTAAQAMRGVYGTYVGAKTGSAEVGGQDKPNGWFTAYRDDVAAAGVVQQGGHGGDSAGPIVASVLKAS
ncbi:penicillin-binding transpeptidase domain-containing protein [Actinacidiphila soli]|uniref:penicillin-binding transpeptidase domain-containing protein n=1 Tax=Actinacidiphila soli TaxID=2487275 RepID=UPI000FCBD78B|nr:penicillin-binding transpeptidase domain-containing protein [Actinacidiphila soli]